jgi:hypothetical protein
MTCPICGTALLNVALNFEASVVASSLANHMRKEHPGWAFLIGLFGAGAILWLLKLIAEALTN